MSKPKFRKGQVVMYEGGWPVKIVAVVSLGRPVAPTFNYRTTHESYEISEYDLRKLTRKEAGYGRPIKGDTEAVALFRI